MKNTSPVKPALRFQMKQLVEIARRYQYPIDERELERLKPTVVQRGFLTKGELEMICQWKSPRSAGHAAKNSEDFVAEITQFCFGTKCERARIESLTLLDGVSWSTSSVILHLFHADQYPILDYRALWSVSLDVPVQYTFDFWWCYVAFCRTSATEAQVDMRTLDRALWQYSKENQAIGN